MARQPKGKTADPASPVEGTKDAAPARKAKAPASKGKGAGKNGGKRKGGEPRTKLKTDAAAIELAAKRAEALEYRLMGFSFAEIAAQMEISKTTAWNYVTEEIKAIPQNAADELRRLELATLDKMQSVAMQSYCDAPEQHLADIIFKVMDRRSKFLSLGVSPDEGDGLERLGRAMGTGFAASLKADEPIYLRPDEPMPAQPVA